MCALPWQTKQGRDSGGVGDDDGDEGAVDRRPAHPPVEQEGEGDGKCERESERSLTMIKKWKKYKNRKNF